MDWWQAYSEPVITKMGTFPKSGEDHNNPFSGGYLDAFLDISSSACMPFEIYV